MSRMFLAVLLLGASPWAGAELIDNFSVGQGPFTVGPGEEIPESQAVLETPSVLGGFRVLAPGLDDEAPAGSSVTVGVAGGELSCRVSIGAAQSDSGGGCSSGYDRGNGALWDLTGSSAFELNITSSGGMAGLQVAVFGPDQNGAAALIYSPTPGALRIPFDQFMTMTPTPVAWNRIDAIMISIVNLEGASGHVSLGRFGTDGPIANGEAVPGDGPGDGPPSDAELHDEAYGNFYSPQRSGEGVQLTLENDGETFVLTYYTYLDGEQVWLIGMGALSDGHILFDEMSITQGGDYGSDFDPADVDSTLWGAIDMSFIDCNSAVLDIEPVIDGFEPFIVEMQRIVPAQCGAGGPATRDRVITGNWYDPARSGEGFQLAYEEGQFALTYYTYGNDDNGKQVWLLGLGERFGDTLIFPDVNMTEGGDFGGRFRAEDVETEFFGAIEMTIEDCNNATIKIESALPGFEDQVLDVHKIVPGSCGG